MFMRIAIPLISAGLVYVALVVFGLPVWVALVIFAVGALSLILWELSKKEAPELVMRQGKWYDERED